jgi:hypothetical protein
MPLGTYWAPELLKELWDCDAGLLILTSDLNLPTGGDTSEDLMAARRWLVYEAQFLMHRRRLGKLDHLVPIFIGTDARRHALGAWAVLAISETVHRYIDPGITERELQQEIEQAASAIKDLCEAECVGGQDHPDEDIASALGQEILAFIPRRTRDEALLDIGLAEPTSLSATDRLEQFKRAHGTAAADRYLAHRLLAGPLPRESGDLDFRAVYYDTVRRIAVEFMLQCDECRRDAGPLQSDLAKHFESMWVPRDAALRFCNLWIDPTVSARSFAFVYELDPGIAARIAWPEVLHEFLLVARDISLVYQDRKGGRRDNRLVSDLVRDFARRRKLQRPSHMFELVAPYAGIDHLLEKLKTHKSARFRGTRSVDTLPLILDSSGLLLAPDVSGMGRLSVGLETVADRPLNLHRIEQDADWPPCIFMLVNKTACPERFAALKRVPDVVTIELDMNARLELRESLGVARDPAMRWQ